MSANVRRREFITLLGGAAAWPLSARAQQQAKLPTIGLWGPSTLSAASQRVARFVQRLRELGWIEGRTVTSRCGRVRWYVRSWRKQGEGLWAVYL